MAANFEAIPVGNIQRGDKIKWLRQEAPVVVTSVTADRDGNITITTDPASILGPSATFGPQEFVTLVG